MADITKLARNASMMANPRPARNYYGDTKYAVGQTHPYLLDETLAYINEYGELASNVYETEMQGIDPDDFYKYVPAKIRVSSSTQLAAGGTMLDDNKRVYVIAPRGVDVVSQGAMMTFAGSVWLAYKPQNVGNSFGETIARRCNAVINTLDYYGNIVPIPISYQKLETQGSSPAVTENMIFAKNYMSCMCQYNEYTKLFKENSRFIIGDAAYEMRGLNNFTREFTMDPDSVHLMTFTISRGEPLDQDNLDLQVADYYSFSWVIQCTAQRQMNVGSTQQLAVSSLRNSVVVQSSTANPISYTYASSNESVLTVDNTGIVTAVGEGTANIIVTLTQNTDVTTTVPVTIADAGSSYVAFITTLPTQLREGDSVTIKAAHYLNGAETADAVTFTFSNVPSSAYRAVAGNDNTYTLTAYGGYSEPLKINIESNGATAEAQIMLLV